MSLTCGPPSTAADSVTADVDASFGAGTVAAELAASSTVCLRALPFAESGWLLPPSDAFGGALCLFSL